MSGPRTQFSRRRLIGGLAALGGAALLAACGQPSRPTPAPTQPPAKADPQAGAPKPADKPAAAAAPTKPAEAPKAADKPAAAAGSGAKILLRLNGIDPPGQEFANKWAAEYGKSKNVEIEIDYTDWASSFQKITTGIAGGTAPDIWMGGGLWTPVMASKNASLPLDSHLKNFKDWEDFYPVCREDVTYKGQVHAVPYRTNARGNLFYRKSLFEKAGLDPKKPPSTWEEAHEYAAKLTQRSGDRIEIAGWHISFLPIIDLSQQYEDALYQNGGNYFNEDRTKPTNSTPEGEEALQFWVDFVEKGIVPKQGMDSGIPNQHAFTAGKVALMPGFPPESAFNAKLYAPQIFEDTAAGPPLMRKERRLQIFVDKYFIYRRSKVPDQAFDLTAALVTNEVNVPMNVNGSGSLPARKAMESADLYQDERYKVFVDNLKYGKPRQIVPQHFDVQPAMGRQVEAAIRGGKSVKQALKDMDEEVTKILQSG